MYCIGPQTKEELLELLDEELLELLEEDLLEEEELLECELLEDEELLDDEELLYAASSLSYSRLHFPCSACPITSRTSTPFCTVAMSCL